MKPILFFLAALLGLGLPSLAAGQDQFGRLVAVSDGSILVAKVGAARGPAGLFHFEVGESGGWSPAGSILPPGMADTGAGLSPSLAVAGAELLVGSGDPTMQFGAHAFRRDGTGSWTADGALAIGENQTSAASGPGGAAVDFAGIMRILQPPPRIVAIQDGLGAVSVPRATGRPVPAVFTYQRGRDGEWTTFATIPRPAENTDERFGAALALAGGELYVSSPGHDGSGVVYRFTRTSGGWEAGGTVGPDSLEAGARFGESMEVWDGWMVVGAPGARRSSGLAFAFRLDDRSADPEILEPSRTLDGQVFGSAIAVDDGEAWIGAPGADARRGRVDRFMLDGGSWGAPSSVPTPGDGGPDPGASFGIAVDLGDGVAVVGAPGAAGGSGGALAFSKRGTEWGPGTWLRSGDGLEAVVEGEVRCDEGQAAGFGCDAVDLMAFLPLSAIGAEPGESVSDVWGWTDPVSGREYALVGRSAGAAIVDVTQASAPEYVGLVEAPRSGPRDLKVYADHLFFTGDGAGNHGMIVFDLTRIRDAVSRPTVFQSDAVYDGVASAHNLVLDPESGFAFPVGASGGGETCGGGLHMVDVRNPKTPVFAGCFTDTEGLIYPGRTHDAQCVVYRGPDERYTGREICFASNETALRIIDVTDKATPAPIGTATYPGLAYVHQGWLTEDQKYYYLDDELDELVGTAPATRTFIYDVAELDDPILVGSVDGPNGATDHNLYVKGDRMYQANYQAGFRLFDISDPEAPEEIGWFDTTPYEGNPPGFVGAWTAYPFFESGTVVVTSMYEGLFILRPQQRRLIP